MDARVKSGNEDDDPGDSDIDATPSVFNQSIELVPEETPKPPSAVKECQALPKGWIAQFDPASNR